MLVPVFKEFLEQHPDVEIMFVSRKNFADLFSDIPRLQYKGVNLDDYKGFWGLKRLSNEILREFKPDKIGDFHNVLRSNLLNLFFRLKSYPIYQLDKGRKEKKNLVSLKNTNKTSLKKNTERYAEVFRKMGYSLSLSHQIKPISEHKQGIGLAPFAQHFGKMLPLEKSFHLALEIAKTTPVYFFGGGEKEVKILQEWEEKIPNTQSLAGKLSLKEELKKISQLELMISMDSANMHLASLVGTRCISIWGQTHPFAGFLGYGQREEDVVQISDLSCRPCSIFGNKDCPRGDWACLERIEIQNILAKINKKSSE